MLYPARPKNEISFESSTSSDGVCCVFDWGIPASVSAFVSIWVSPKLGNRPCDCEYE